jgi:hypothetical protein
LVAEAELYWAKLAAIGQLAGAAATFLAVIVSLYIAKSSRRPRLKLKIGERLIIQQGAETRRVLMFSVANLGERPVHVRGIGWRTGWLRWGPQWLTRRFGVQLTGEILGGTDPPYELQAGEEKSSFADMANVIAHAKKRKGPPFFTRDMPWFGRCRVPIWGYVYTADGYTLHVRAEPTLVKALVAAELEALKSRDTLEQP